MDRSESHRPTWSTREVRRAFVITVLAGIFWFLAWLFLRSTLDRFPEYSNIFMILAGISLFFTFSTRASRGTIYRYAFEIIHATFLILYLIYATNAGVITLDITHYQITMEFTPLLGFILAINTLSIAKSIFAAAQFRSKR